MEQSIVNLRTFPWIRSREKAGSLALHGAWFDIGLGELHAYTDARWVLLYPIADPGPLTPGPPTAVLRRGMGRGRSRARLTASDG